VPFATSEADVTAKAFAVPAEKGNLYIVREENFIGRAYTFEVLVDGRLLGATGPRSYLLVPLSPGVHKVASTHTRFYTIDIEIKAGQNYFIRQIPNVDWPEPSASLLQINEENGRAAVFKCKLVPNQF
jgi:hypothetical protein